MKKTITLLSAAVLLAVGAQAQKPDTIRAEEIRTYAKQKSVIAQTSVDTAIRPYVWTAGDRMPEFPGGMDKVSRFLAKNVRYPAAARRANIQGRVAVRFVVAADGTISNATALSHFGGGLEEEAVRVVNKMPKWEPAIQDGKPVAVYFTLPISFWLE